MTPMVAACPMQLTRSLACIDTETTGTNPDTDRVVELAVVLLHPDGSRTSRQWLVNPGVPIPEEASAIHGLWDVHVADAPPFTEVARELSEVLAGADITGFNVRTFDLPLLRAEYRRAGLAWPCDGARVVDSLAIFHARERRDLAAAVRLYCEREHDGAHGALPDAEAALDVLLAQMERYPDLPRDVAALDVASGGRQPDWATECGRIRWSADGDAVLAFGKYKGTRLVDAERGFLKWLVDRDFPDDVKAMASMALRGKAPGPEGHP